MAIWPFQAKQSDREASRLLEAVIAASRRPALYGPGGVPDTLSGRFELLSLHAALALVRLRAAPEQAALAQLFTDKLFRHIDSGLREAGVGDLSVPKRMRRLAGDFYGRLEAYAAPLAAGDSAGLADAIGRNVLGEGADPSVTTKLADYAARVAERQQAGPVAALAEASAWEPGSA